MMAPVFKTTAALQSALLDPVFLVCLCSAAGNPEVIAEFELYAGRGREQGGAPAERAPSDVFAGLADELLCFVNFVHGVVYARLDRQVREEIRAAVAHGKPGANGPGAFFLN